MTVPTLVRKFNSQFEGKHPRDHGGRFVSGEPSPISPSMLDDIFGDFSNPNSGVPRDGKRLEPIRDMTPRERVGMSEYQDPKMYRAIQAALRDPEHLREETLKIDELGRHRDKFGDDSTLPEGDDDRVREIKNNAETFAAAIARVGSSSRGQTFYRNTEFNHEDRQWKSKLERGEPFAVEEPGFLSVGDKGDAESIGSITHKNPVTFRLRVTTDTKSVNTADFESGFFTVTERIFGPGTILEYEGTPPTVDQHGRPIYDMVLR